MKKFYKIIPAMLPLLSMVTMSTDGSFTVSTGELQPSFDVVNNGAISIFNLFLMSWPTLLKWSIIIGIVLFIASRIFGHHKK